MARFLRRFGRRFWLLLAAVLGVHALGLTWLVRQSEGRSVLQSMERVVFARLLQPAAPRLQGGSAGTKAAQQPGTAAQGERLALAPAAAASAARPGGGAPAGSLDAGSLPADGVADATGAATPATASPAAASLGDAVDDASPPTVPQGLAGPHAPPAAEPPLPEGVAADVQSAAQTAGEGQDRPAAHPLESSADPASAPGAGGRPDASAQSTAARTESPGGAHPAAPLPGLSPGPAGSGEAAPGAPTSAAAGSQGWPPDTRLHYRLGGRFRGGPLYGDARVLWQRDAQRYQVQLDIDVSLLARMVITSQGQVTPEGLHPQAYEEVRPGRKRRGATFAADRVALDDGRSEARPAGMQDAASQFLELAHRFATGREPLAAGRSVDLWLGRPGGVDLWTYDVVGLETVPTPGFGDVPAWRLKPRPVTKARGKVAMEMWFAPSLQYLPVRIRLWTGSDAVLELLAERIEQR